MPILGLNVIKVTVSGTYLGELCENVWYCFGGSGTPDEAELLSVAAEFQSGYAELTVPLSDQLFINSITCRFMGDVLGPEAELFITPPQQGGSASPGLPGNVAFCIRLRTGSPGRSNRGRKYFSGLTEASVTGNQVSDTLAGDLAAAINTMNGALTAAGHPLCIASETASTVALVTSAGFFDLNTDSMRRRLAGRGR